MTLPKPQAARDFALRAHGDQRYGEHPYVVHLDAVAELVLPHGESAQVLAYLHDTVEDTATDLPDIQRLFGPRIAAQVALLTDEPGETRRLRKAATHAKLTQVTAPQELALVVKCADRLANVRACVHDDNRKLLKLYRREHPAFRAAVHRPSLCDPLWSELDTLLEE